VARIGPVARAILSDLANYPLPNRSVPGVTGNFVGDTQLEIRAHQGDARVDSNLSRNDRSFARYSFATYEDTHDRNPFPLVFSTHNDQPFWNVGGAWNRIFGPTIVNEVLVGFSHTRVIGETADWAGVGDANATYGIAGGHRRS
jgi:hypothetical protein